MRCTPPPRPAPAELWHDLQEKAHSEGLISKLLGLDCYTKVRSSSAGAPVCKAKACAALASRACRRARLPSSSTPPKPHSPTVSLAAGGAGDGSGVRAAVGG